MESHGSIPETAEHPKYALESRRLDSFYDWPKQIKQKPDQLADAGLFYSGSSDRVICFSCGGGISQWEEDDDVWDEHGFHYEKCKYVLLCKGENFFEQIIERKARARMAARESQKPEMAVKPNDETLDENSKECKICLVNELNTVFIPCGHIAACGKCASSLKECPICRQIIKEVLRIYFS